MVDECFMVGQAMGHAVRADAPSGRDSLKFAVSEDVSWRVADRFDKRGDRAAIDLLGAQRSGQADHGRAVAGSVVHDERRFGAQNGLDCFDRRFGTYPAPAQPPAKTVMDRRHGQMPGDREHALGLYRAKRDAGPLYRRFV